MRTDDRLDLREPALFAWGYHVAPTTRASARNERSEASCSRALLSLRPVAFFWSTAFVGLCLRLGLLAIIVSLAHDLYADAQVDPSPVAPAPTSTDRGHTMLRACSVTLE